MKVVLRRTFSQILEVLSGISQDSVLGPLLFLLFVNELPWIKSEMKMLADDTMVWSFLVQNKNRNRQHHHARRPDGPPTLWSNTWQLKFNADKCISGTRTWD